MTLLDTFCVVNRDKIVGQGTARLILKNEAVVRFTLLISGVLLLIILVRNRIRDMLGTQIRKFTFRRISYKFRTSSEKNISLYTIYWYKWRVRTSGLLSL